MVWCENQNDLDRRLIFSVQDGVLHNVQEEQLSCFIDSVAAYEVMSYLQSSEDYHYLHANTSADTSLLWQLVYYSDVRFLSSQTAFLAVILQPFSTSDNNKSTGLSQ